MIELAIITREQLVELFPRVFEIQGNYLFYIDRNISVGSLSVVSNSGDTMIGVQIYGQSGTYTNVMLNLVLHIENGEMVQCNGNLVFPYYVELEPASAVAIYDMGVIGIEYAHYDDMRDDMGRVKYDEQLIRRQYTLGEILKEETNE